MANTDTGIQVLYGQMELDPNGVVWNYPITITAKNNRQPVANAAARFIVNSVIVAQGTTDADGKATLELKSMPGTIALNIEVDTLKPRNISIPFPAIPSVLQQPPPTQPPPTQPPPTQPPPTQPPPTQPPPTQPPPTQPPPTQPPPTQPPPTQPPPTQPTTQEQQNVDKEDQPADAQDIIITVIVALGCIVLFVGVGDFNVFLKNFPFSIGFLIAAGAYYKTRKKPVKNKTLATITFNLTILLFVLLLINIAFPFTYTKFISWVKTTFTTKGRADVVVQSTKGWRVSGNELVADLEPGKESTISFHLFEGQSTPWLILPPERYRLSMNSLKTVLINDGKKEVAVHPDEDYNSGISTGKEVRRKYTAISDDTDIIVTINRLN